MERFQCDRTVYHLKTNQTPTTRLTGEIPFQGNASREEASELVGQQASFLAAEELGR